MGIYDINYDLNKYKVFYAVAQCNSFSKAAELLHISQPAISYSIKELEEQLNIKLFIRSKTSIKLTDDGEKLMYYVQKAFGNLLKAEETLKEEQKDVTRVIRIGIYSHISLIMLPNIIKNFIKIYPNARFSIICSTNEELTKMLKDKELDFIVLQYPAFLKQNDYKEEIICEMENCFFGTKDDYIRYQNDKSLDNIPVILPFEGYLDIDGLEEKLKRENISIKNNVRSYTNELLNVFVEKGIGIGWGLKKLIEKELKEKRLYEIPINFKIPNTIFSIIYDDKFLTDSTRTFINYFKEHVKEEIKIKE